MISAGLRTMLGAMGIDAEKVEVQIGQLSSDVHIMATEVVIQGILLRRIAEKLEITDIPPQPELRMITNVGTS